MDKLDGRIDQTFYDREASEWRAEQSMLLADMQTHQDANRGYLDEGLRILELARRAQDLFRSQPAHEKRQLLDFVLSNCSWKDGRMTPTWRKPFDLLASAVTTALKTNPSGVTGGARSEEWLSCQDGRFPSSGRFR